MSNNVESTMSLKDREPEQNSRKNSCQTFIWVTPTMTKDIQKLQITYRMEFPNTCLYKT